MSSFHVYFILLQYVSLVLDNRCGDAGDEIALTEDGNDQHRKLRNCRRRHYQIPIGIAVGALKLHLHTGSVRTEDVRK